MKLTLQLKILPDAGQAETLRRTTERFNAAASHAAVVGFQSGTFDRDNLQKLCYQEIRDTFGLSAQLAVRAIGKAVEVFKRDKSRAPVFRKDSALVYDPRCYGFKDTTRAVGVPKKPAKPSRKISAATKILAAKIPSASQALAAKKAKKAISNSLNLPENPTVVSLLTDVGRLLIPLSLGDHQRQQLSMVRGQADLVCKHGQWFLCASMEVPEAPIREPVAGSVLGVDLGVANVAVTSDGTIYSGAHVETVRVKRHGQRRSLQRAAATRRKTSGRRKKRGQCAAARRKKDSQCIDAKRKKDTPRAAARRKKNSRRPKSIRRRLQKLAGKEARFRKDVNHCISKQIVQIALDTNRSIAVEDLTGIRSRIRFAKDQRARMSGWSFAQLLLFLAYKARKAGVFLETVYAAYTSQTCSRCGHCAKKNRPSQAVFRCTACGYSVHADINAAQNIAAKAAVNRLKVSAATALENSRIRSRQGQAIAFRRQ